MQNSKKQALIFILFITLLFIQISCKKTEMEIVKDDMEMQNMMAALKGTFITSAHTTTGTAEINKEKTMIHFTNFKTDPGPDLNIYLASDISKIKTDFVDLGDIKGTKGDFMYDVPSKTDFAKYKYVVVWCVDFNVNFGYAELK